jgi:serine protease Do
MSINPFYVGTCEDIANGEQPIVFDHIYNDPYKPFVIQDPFGLRKAIVPVFRRDVDGQIYGMGTAFHIDGWGTFLTADHVIDFARHHPKSASNWFEISHNPNGSHPVLYLGCELIIGQININIPREAFLTIDRMTFIMGEKQNPLMNTTEPKNIIDLAVMRAIIQPNFQAIHQPHFLPVKGSLSCPEIGETVLAVGFPELNCQQLDERVQNLLLKEGMYGAYGRVTAIHPDGRNETYPTPVIEVECNWPHGMSGGPVFNSLGEVIGLVSSEMSFSPDDTGNGVGSATCFSSISNFSKFVPTLDISQPGFRKGWAVLRSESCHLAGFFETEVEAQQLADSMSAEYQVKYGINKFGTDGFICSNTLTSN